MKKLALLVSLVLVFSLSSVFATVDIPENASQSEMQITSVANENAEDEANLPGASTAPINEAHEAHEDHNHEEDTTATNQDNGATVGAIIAIVIVVAVVAVSAVLRKD